MQYLAMVFVAFSYFVLCGCLLIYLISELTRIQLTYNYSNTIATLVSICGILVVIVITSAELIFFNYFSNFLLQKLGLSL